MSNNKPLGDAGRSMAMDMVASGGLTEDFGWTGEAAQQMFSTLMTAMQDGNYVPGNASAMLAAQAAYAFAAQINGAVTQLVTADGQTVYQAANANMATYNFFESDYGITQGCLSCSGSSANGKTLKEGVIPGLIGFGMYTAGAIASVAEWATKASVLSDVRELGNAAYRFGTESRKIVRSINSGAKQLAVAKTVGRNLFFVGVAISVVTVYADPTKENITLALLDTSFAAIATFGGPVGWGVGAVYAVGRIGYDFYKAAP